MCNAYIKNFLYLNVREGMVDNYGRKMISRACGRRKSS